MNILLLGAGSKWGAIFTKFLSSQGCYIDLVTSTGIEDQNVVNHKIDWNTLSINDLDLIVRNLSKEKYDLVFFNQNSGGGPNDKCFSPEMEAPLDGWVKNLWIDCQMPYYLIKRLTDKIHENTKIGWMLTGLINSEESEQYKYGGYASAKTMNLHLMRNFSQFNKGIYFCLQPIWFPPDEELTDCQNIYETIKTMSSKDNGKILLKTGREWEYFRTRR